MTTKKLTTDLKAGLHNAEAVLRNVQCPANADQVAKALAHIEALEKQVEEAERAVRVTVWNFLRDRGVKQDDCYPIIEGAVTSYRALLNSTSGDEQ